MLAVLAIMAVCASSSQAQQYKYLPTLTLTKTFAVNGPNNPNDVTAADTQYVAEAGPGEKRYFLMPVFIKNVLDSTYNPSTQLGAEPIYSFRFKIQYNRTLLRAIGVQKRGVLPLDTMVAAKNFNLSWDIDEDSTYKLQTVGVSSANGERIMITGSSATALPLPKKANARPADNGPEFRDTSVFLYVLFEVVGQSQLGGPGVGNRDQVIISNDTLEWNNYRASATVRPGLTPVVPPFMVNRGFDPNPRNQTGIFPTPVLPVTYPNNYGSAVVVITQRPRIELFPPTRVILSDLSNPSLFELVRPMQTQYGNNNFIYTNIQLRNSIPQTFLRNVSVETDQPWLRIDLNAPPAVGGGGTPPERGVFIRDITNSQMDFNVVANPSLLPNSDGAGYPTPGIYVGYVTIRSSEANNSAVRLKVTLIVNRNPLEPTLPPPGESNQPRGIQLLFRNSGPHPDTTYLTFGTGVGARDSVDTLFGEALAPSAPVPGTFFARFFPPSLDTDQNNPFPGIIDVRNFTPRPTNGESSIDIRNYRTNTTLVYCVKFGAGAPQNYPIVVEYNTNDFPNGSQLFVRDNVNGRFLSTNLRQATSLGGTRRYFTIQDPNVTGFCIEYTVPAVVQFPEINTGWNLVSLPVIPSDARSSVVFPNIASGKPFRFSQSQYIADDTVRVGVGYFVKYGQVKDITVAGTRVNRIGANTPFEVRVYQGWNTVGGLSVLTTVDSMSFSPLPGLGITPNRVGEVYRYVTDRGYEQVSLIVPGYGYWVKVDADGLYELSAPAGNLTQKVATGGSAFQSLNRLSINDNGQKVGTLYFGQSSINNAQYELPPAPGAELFDVRFDNNGFVSASKGLNGERIVKIQGADYPVVLSVARPDADYTVTDAATGEVLGTFKQGEYSNVTISNPSVKAVKLVGAESSEMNLGSAYPNPAFSKINFNFAVPAEQKVTVALYNPVGAEVARLFDGRANGTQTVEFSTEGLPAGVYFYKMTAAGFSQVRQVVVAK
jgi:hypothetical protein